MFSKACVLLAISANAVWFASGISYAQNIIPSFNNPWADHFDTPPTMRATANLASNKFTINITRIAGEQKGWAGGCLHSSSDIDLTSYGQARVKIESNHNNQVEVKLECSDYQTCQHLIYNDKIQGQQELIIDMPGGGDSLQHIRKVCFAVTGEGMEPSVNNTKLIIKQVLFTK